MSGMGRAVVVPQCCEAVVSDGMIFSAIFFPLPAALVLSYNWPLRRAAFPAVI